jgi:hypothetical protein
MAFWEFILCKTPPPRNPTGPLERICPIAFDGEAQVEIVRNRSGSFACSVDLASEAAYSLLDRVNLGDVRGSMRKCVVVKRDKEWLWSGPISALSGSIEGEGGKLAISAVGWLEYLYQREAHLEKVWSNTAHDDIVYEMMDIMQTQDPTYPLPVFKGGNFGEMIVRESFTLNKTQKFGEAIQRLSDVESGFDMDVDPITRELNLYAWDTYRVNRDAKLGYHWGPNNIESLQWQENGLQARTRITAVGKSGAAHSGLDTDAADEYGILEETTSLGEADDEILLPYVAAELVYRSRPIVNYTLVPKLNAESPRLFDDFKIGDLISFTAREGAFKVSNQGIRVFGASISVDADMNEKVSALQTSPAT